MLLAALALLAVLAFIYLRPYFSRINVAKSDIGKQSTVIFDKVIVMGGSIGGLLAAATFSKHANKVIILEKAAIPGKNESIVPQGTSPHILLSRGLEIASRVIPGLKEAMIEAGANQTEMSDFSWHAAGGARAKITKGTGLSVFMMTRGLLESVIRQQISKHIPNIEVRDQCQVVSLKHKDESNGILITGVVYKDHNEQEVELYSDLVVDCCGITTPSVRIFKDLFGITIRKTAVKSFMAYSSAIFEMPESAISKELVFYMQVPPVKNYGSILYKIEGHNRYMVTSFSLNNRKVPKNHSAMEEMLLKDGHLDAHHYVKHGTPVSDFKHYKKEGSQWHHFEELRNIRGFVAMGDSVVSGNPIFGQGMSMAAEASLVIDDLLRKNGYTSDFCSEFQQRLSYALTAQWVLANSSDMQFKGTVGGSSILRAMVPILAKGMNHQFVMGAVDEDYVIDFLHVMHMTEGFLKRLLIPLPIRRMLGYDVRQPL